MLGDFNGDGLDDVLTPDTTALSTPENPITLWNVARNQGNGFAAPKVAFSQEWSVAIKVLERALSKRPWA
jgi:hypothetical protein